MSSTSQSRHPKARFFTRLNERDYLGVSIWSGKTDPTAEVIVVQLRRRDGDNWDTVGRIAVYRTSDGTYSKLPERQGICNRVAIIAEALNPKKRVRKTFYYFEEHLIGGERLQKEKFPVSETIKIIEGLNLYKTEKWWAAVVLQDYFGRKQLAVYLWIKKGDQWKRKQKFVIHNENEWARIRESVEKLLPNLR